MGDIQQRKTQHIALAMEEGSQGKIDLWSKYLLPYTALPEMDLAEVNTEVSLLGKTLNQPLIIASMTGGSVHAEMINTNLALAARETKVAMGVGSQRVALEKEEAEKTFKLVRKLNPEGVVFANMGAVQLNYGHGVESYKRIVDMVKTDALYLHINPMQEAIQPEGDTNWKNILKKIEKLVSEINVPVWVKEVGNGLGGNDVRRLIEVGVKGIDVAGVGGTSWTWIEGRRADNPRLTDWFSDYGIPTDVALREIMEKKRKGVSVVASGGVRSPIQGLKSHILGADYYSAARPFLETAIVSAEETIRLIRDWEKGLKIAMFGVGINNWEKAGKVKMLSYKSI